MKGQGRGKSNTQPLVDKMKIRTRRKVIEGNRVPRPMGLTYASIGLRQSITHDPNKEKEQRMKLQMIMIKQWIANGMILNGKLISIENMSLLIGLPSDTIMRTMNKEFIDMKRIMGKEELGTLTSVMIGICGKKILESEAHSDSRLRMLEASEGGTYRAFISTEVNKAMGNKLQAVKQITDFTKVLLDASKAYRESVPGDPNPNAKSIKYLGTDEAIILINSQHKSMLEDEGLIEAKEKELLGLPNIDGRNQDLTSIGIRHTGQVDPKPGEDASPRNHANSHESRGNKGFGLVVDEGWADDFTA